MELPSVPALRGVIERFARLRARLGDELGDRPLVLPTSAFFPDEFRADAEGAKRFVSRLKGHAGMSDIPTRTRVVGLEGDEGAGCGPGGCAPPKAAGAGGGCGTGCGPSPQDPGEPVERLVDLGEAWRITIPAVELRQPVLLAANLARLLSFVFLAETRSEGEQIEAPADVTADLTGVCLGFGVLLLQGSYMYRKSGCGGPTISRATRLGPGELAVATALFAALGKHRGRAAQRELDTTQAAVFAEARAWVDSNRALLELLERDPTRVGRGDFPLGDTQPWLVRVLGRKEKSASSNGDLDLGDLDASKLAELDDLLATLPAAAKAPTRSRSPVDEDLKALVSEALEETASSSS